MKHSIRCAIVSIASLPIMACGMLNASAETSEDDLQSIQNLAISTLPKGSRLLATCGASVGKGYYLSPKVVDWDDDQISKGRTIFVAGPDGEPNILFRDARGAFVNAIKDGAKITYSFLSPDENSFGIIETYPATGVTQTYAIANGPDGKRTMLSTAIKVRISIANITKVAAFTANCI
jgi:hypothetical protein